MLSSIAVSALLFLGTTHAQIYSASLENYSGWTNTTIPMNACTVDSNCTYIATTYGLN